MKTDKQLESIITDILKLNSIDEKNVLKIFRKYPKNNKGLYKKSDVLIYYKHLKSNKLIQLDELEEEKLFDALKLKKTRTISGVTPVTVLTKPFPCPGQCIFCPNDVRMPKSYLADEPGAQRAFKNKFDPYQQTYNRLVAYNQIGHPTDKIELIVLGGTFTAYPLNYQIWFIKRCFDAMNDFSKENSLNTIDINAEIPYDKNKIESLSEKNLSYNKIVSLALNSTKNETATFEELEKAQKINETAESRCIGLVLETRPDEITKETVTTMRHLGATKIQLGIQSLDDEILQANKRGHTVDDNAKAFALLRRAGFKIHIHWMPNLYKSTPEKDIEDYKKLFNDDRFKPDEIKVYPCSLIESAELMKYYKKGLWKPYTNGELIKVLTEVFKATPEYCRITRVIRDISSDDIVVGNKKTNFRQIVEKSLKAQGIQPVEIRSREIRNKQVNKKDLQLKITTYSTTVSTEYFLQFVTKENKIAGFLRLSLPKRISKTSHFIKELTNCAIIREVHVYGPSIEIGEHKTGKAQHLGLGTQLINKATEIAKENDFKKLAVISSIGTRKYYEKFGFKLENLYQIVNL